MISPELKRDLILSVGTHKGKRPLSPVEVAEGFEKAHASSMTEQEIVEMVQLRVPTMIGRFKRLLNLSPDQRHLVAWGSSSSTISFTAASEVARLHPNEHGVVLNSVLENGLNKNEVMQIVQIRNRSGKDISDCIADVLKLRPTIVRRHVFVGALTNEEILSYLDNLKQAGRDEILSNSLNDRIPAGIKWSGRLGKGQFSVVGGDRLSKFLNSLEPNFEHVINGWLLDEVKDAE
jgi:hypothetical protein